MTASAPAVPLSASRTRGLSLDATYLCLALMPIALRVLSMPVAPHDFWWHMAQGRAIAQTGAVPTLDAFTYTRAGEPFYNQSWLSQWLFFQLHSLGGVPLVVFAQTLCVLTAYGLILWLCVKRTGQVKLPVALLLLAIVPMSFDNWQVRPQTFALPFFAAFVVILSAHRLRWFNALWLLPILMVLWVNLHGSFEQGLALVVLALIGEALMNRQDAKSAKEDSQENDFSSSPPLAPLASWRFNSLAFWGALTFAATLLNPRGLGVYHYVHDVLRHPSTRFSAEWAVAGLNEFTGIWFWGFLLVTAVGLWKLKPRLLLADWLIVLPFLLVAMKSGRSVLWLGLVALPLLCLVLSPKLAPRRADSPRNLINVALVVIAWLPVLMALPWIKPVLGGELLDDSTPVRAVAALQKMPSSSRPQRLWHTEGDGSYLAWTGQKSWIDTRFELFLPQQWRDHIDLKAGRRVPELVKKRRFDGALVHPREQKALLNELKKLGWRAMHRDTNTVLLAKIFSHR